MIYKIWENLEGKKRAKGIIERVFPKENADVHQEVKCNIKAADIPFEFNRKQKRTISPDHDRKKIKELGRRMLDHMSSF
jgi:hypothetical protein